MFQVKSLFPGQRGFVVGDIHGCFDELKAGLDQRGFDYDNDMLFSVGDLVDRGPDSHRAVEFIQKPWFWAVRGNHEQMTIDAGGTPWHVGNGGLWFNQLIGHERDMFIHYFSLLPLLMQVNLPDGRKIGLAHASFPPTGNNRSEFSCDWNDAPALAAKTDWPMDDNEILWDRYQVGRARKVAATGEKGQKFAGEFNVKNIDHVYFGHTPLKEPLTVGNCTWLDTGCFATGKLTIVEL